jgi:hypothetical protein
MNAWLSYHLNAMIEDYFLILHCSTVEILAGHVF